MYIFICICIYIYVYVNQTLHEVSHRSSYLDLIFRGQAASKAVASGSSSSLRRTDLARVSTVVILIQSMDLPIDLHRY